MIQGPRTPKGGCTGVLVYDMEGRGAVFPFRQGGHLDPPKVCSIDSARREDHHLVHSLFSREKIYM